MSHFRYSLFANREYRTGVLKPQDLFVVLRLALAVDDDRPSFAALALELGMSPSEVHAAVKRAAQSGLVERESRRVNRTNLQEFLLHGVRYAFPAQHSGVTRGVITSYAAPPLRDSFSVGELPPVWPHPSGATRGKELAPLYRSAPDAALRNPELHDVGWAPVSVDTGSILKAPASTPRARIGVENSRPGSHEREQTQNTSPWLSATPGP